jgi:hypothetical protein
MPLTVAECLRGEFLLVQQTAESAASADAALVIIRCDSDLLGHGRLLLERALRRAADLQLLHQPPLERCSCAGFTETADETTRNQEVRAP